MLIGEKYYTYLYRCTYILGPAHFRLMHYVKTYTILYTLCAHRDLHVFINHNAMSKNSDSTPILNVNKNVMDSLQLLRIISSYVYVYIM